LFIVLKPARYVETDGTVEFGEILIFIGDGFIITVRHGEAALHEVRMRTEERPDLLRCGPGAALYAIVDRIVDDYQPVIAAHDRGVGRDHRRSDADRRCLRDELQAHAGARLELRLPARDRPDRGRVRLALPLLPAHRLAVASRP